MKAVIPALAGALFLFAQGTSQAQQQDFSKFEIQTTELGHGVYMLEGAGGNITVAASPEGVIMVDTQFAPMTAKIKAAIAEITPQPIRCVIDTGHGPLAKIADLIEFRDMVKDSRDRVAKLIAAGKGVDEVVQAKPLADWYAKRGGDDARTDAWVRYVYQSLKASQH